MNGKNEQEIVFFWKMERKDFTKLSACDIVSNEKGNVGYNRATTE
jgi:hypothetical protein